MVISELLNHTSVKNKFASWSIMFVQFFLVFSIYSRHFPKLFRPTSFLPTPFSVVMWFISSTVRLICCSMWSIFHILMDFLFVLNLHSVEFTLCSVQFCGFWQMSTDRYLLPPFDIQQLTSPPQFSHAVFLLSTIPSNPWRLLICFLSLSFSFQEFSYK